MATVSFQVIDGVDKGRCFSNLDTPVTIGREEGNVIRLNDERVSRFHAKVQEDQGQVVLTDLDSTNGTCVNGEPIQLRLLRPGDRVSIGRSILVFGTPEEIAGDMRSEDEVVKGKTSAATIFAKGGTKGPHTEMGTDVAAAEPGQSDVFERPPPKLPNKLSPAQAAQLSEVIDYLHRSLATATETIHIPSNAKEARLPLPSWQRIQAVLGFLARYSRQVAEPDEPTERLK